MRDRTGELVDDEDQAPADVPPPHYCRDGWLDRDAEPAVPCTICRPWLAQPRQRPERPDPDRVHAGVQRCRDALIQARTSPRNETPR